MSHSLTILTLINLYIGKFPNVCCIFYFEKHLNAARTIFMVSQNTFVSYEKLIKISWKIILKELKNFELKHLIQENKTGDSS